MKSIKRGLEISEELQQHVINGKSFFYRILTTHIDYQRIRKFHAFIVI